MKRRRTVERAAGHAQTVFGFFADFVTTPELPMKLHADDPNFEPDRSNLVPIDGFLLHPVHARRLREVRGDRSLAHLGRDIEGFRSVYSDDSEDETKPDRSDEI